MNPTLKRFVSLILGLAVLAPYLQAQPALGRTAETGSTPFASQAITARLVDSFHEPQDVIAARQARWEASLLQDFRDQLIKAHEGRPSGLRDAELHSILEAAALIPEQTLLLEQATEIVSASARLQNAKAILETYVLAREQVTQALRAKNPEGAAGHAKDMRDAIIRLRWTLRSFSDFQAVWRNDVEKELEAVQHAVEFLRDKSRVSAPAAFRDLAFEHILDGLTRSTIDASDRSVVWLAEIQVRTLEEAWWPDLSEWLRFEALRRTLASQRELSDNDREHILLSYLLSRIREPSGTGYAFTAVSAVHFWKTKTSLEKADWQAALVAAERDELSTMDKAGHSPSKPAAWLGQYAHRFAAAILAAVSVLGIAALWSNSPDRTVGQAPAISDADGPGAAPEPLTQEEQVATTAPGRTNIPSVETQTQVRERREAREKFAREARRIETEIQRTRAIVKVAQAKAKELENQTLERSRALEQAVLEAAKNAAPLDPQKAQDSAKKFQENAKAQQPGQRETPEIEPPNRRWIPSTKNIPAWLLRLLPQRANDNPGLGRPGDAASAGTESLGVKRTVVTFERPVQGYIGQAVWEEFDAARGLWVRDPVNPQDLTVVKDIPNPTPVNRGKADVTSSFVLLPIPDGLAPVASSFRFSQGGVVYDVRQDRFGHFYLWLQSGRPPMNVTFDLVTAAPRVLRDIPRGITQQAMEDWPWESDTAAAIDRARSANSIQEKIAILKAHIDATMEYTIGDASNKRLQNPPGHIIGNTDRLREAIAGKPWRFQDCSGNAFFIAMARAVELHARQRSVWAVRSPSTEVTSWQAHALSEVYNPATGEWVSVDATPPDRFPNSDEASYEQALPIQQVEDPQVVQARNRLAETQAAARAARETILKSQREAGALVQALGELSKKRQELEKPIAAPTPNLLKTEITMAGLLAEAAQRFREAARSNPTDVVQYLNTGRPPTHGRFVETLEFLLADGGATHGEVFRYFAAYLELATEAVRGKPLEKDIWPWYLRLQARWLSSPESMEPLPVVSFGGGTTPTDVPGLYKAEVPVQRTTHWDVRHSLPFRVKAPGPGVLSTLAADAPEPIRLVQTRSGDLLGYQTRHQLLQRETGTPAFFPPTTASTSPSIFRGPDGPVGLTRVGDTELLVDLVTGQRIHRWPRLTTVHEVEFDDFGNGFSLISFPNANLSEIHWRVERLNDRRHYVVSPGPNSDVHLARLEGSVVAYTTAGIVPGQSAQTIHDVTRDQIVRLPYLMGPVPLGVRGKIISAGNREFVLLQGEGYGALFDMASGTKITEIGFTGEEIDAVIQAGRSFQWIITTRDVVRQTYRFFIYEPGKPASRVETLSIPGLPKLLGEKDGRFYFLDQAASQVVILDRGKKEVWKIASDYLVGTPVFHDGTIYSLSGGDGRGPVVAVDIEGARQLSAPDAAGVTSPILVDEKVLFAEEINGQWRWRSAGNPLMEEVLVIGDHTGPGSATLPPSNRAIVVAKHGKDSHVYHWNGEELDRLSNRPIRSAVVAGQKVYYVSSTNWAFYRAGEPNPLLKNELVQSPLTLSPDGRVFFVTSRPRTDWLFLREAGRSEPLATLSGPRGLLVGTLEISPDAAGVFPVAISPAGTLHVIVRDRQDLHLWSSKASGASPAWVLSDVTQADPPVFSPSGVGYLRVQRKGDWQFVNLETRRVVAQAPYLGPVTFGVDGEGYYPSTDAPEARNVTWTLGTSVRRLSDSKELNQGIFQISELFATTDGRLYAAADHRLVDLIPKDIVVGGFLPHAGGPRGARGTAASVAWMSEGSDSRRWPVILSGPKVWVADPRVTRAPVDLVRLLEQQRGREPDLQIGPAGSALLYLAGDHGQFRVLTDPYQELDRTLHWAVRQRIENPSLARGPEWQEFERALIARIEKQTGPFMPAERRLALHILRARTAAEPKAGQGLAELAKLPGHHAEARRVLASLVRRQFEQHRRQHGELPLNPVGVRDAAWLNRTLNHLVLTFAQRPMPWRVGSPPPDAQTLAFNRELARLISENPWLALRPEEAAPSWSPSWQLALRVASEAAREPVWWILLAELLSAAAGVYAETKRLQARTAFGAVLLDWSRQLVSDVQDLPERHRNFTFDRALKHLSRDQRRLFKGYAKLLREESPDVQAAAFLILRRDGLIPPERTLGQRVLQPLMLYPMKSEVVRSRALERVWSLLAADQDGRVVAGDRIALNAFLDLLERLMTPIRSRLQEEHLLNTPLAMERAA